MILPLSTKAGDIHSCGHPPTITTTPIPPPPPHNHCPSCCPLPNLWYARGSHPILSHGVVDAPIQCRPQCPLAPTPQRSVLVGSLPYVDCQLPAYELVQHPQRLDEQLQTFF